MGKKNQSSRNINKKSENSSEINRTISTKKRKQLDRLVDELLKKVVVQIPNNENLWEVYEEVNRILCLIKSLESPAEESALKGRQVAIDNFVLWIKDNGVSCEDIEICDYPGMDFGLEAKKSFPQGSLILNVPRKLMLTEECAKTSILGNLITKDPILKYMPNVTLAMYLLLKKFSVDSFWKPYIDILPSSYTTVLYFSRPDILELKGSLVWKPALKLCLNIARQYAHFYKLLQNSDDPVAQQMKDHFTYNEYRWAVSTVMTRQNVVPPSNPEGPASTPALIPLWDLCNHTQGEITTNFDQERDQAECFALRDFKEGEQIFIFYGVRTNAFFFLHNGFVYEDNAEDTLEVSLGISSQDPLQPLKLALLALLPPAPYLLRAPPHAPLSAPLLAFSRVFVMDKEELTDWLSSSKYPALLSTESSVKSETNKKAHSFLHTRCSLLLAACRKAVPAELTSSEDPNSESEKTVRNEKHRSLVRQLKECEMKILQSAINFTKTVMSAETS